MLTFKPTVKCAADRDTREVHIKSALSRGLLEFEDMSFPHKEMILCGSGPSLAEEIGTIEALDLPIMAVNKAHDYLIEHDILPAYGFTGHPTKEMPRNFKYKNLAVTYIIASQCHPALFDHLEGYSVYVSHWLAGENEQEILKDGKLLIGGGITSGLRALIHCYYKGTRKFHIFGYDSSYKGDQRNINRTAEAIIFHSNIQGSKKDYKTEIPFAMQVDQFQDVMILLKDLEIEVYGDGLSQEMVRRREEEFGVRDKAN